MLNVDGAKIGARIREARKAANMTQDELGAIIGINKSTVAKYENGHIKTLDLNKISAIAKATGVTPEFLSGWDTPTNIVEPPTMHPIPIVACIPAGKPIFSESDIDGYELADVKNPEGHVFVRVKGDSMIGAGILDGDLALIRLQSTAENGDIVACQVNGDCETTLKRFKQEGTSILLIPANTAYEPIMLTAKQFAQEQARILGVLAGINRKY